MLMMTCAELLAQLREANNDVRLLLDVRSLNEAGAKPYAEGVVPAIRARLAARLAKLNTLDPASPSRTATE